MRLRGLLGSCLGHLYQFEGGELFEGRPTPLSFLALRGVVSAISGLLCPACRSFVSTRNRLCPLRTCAGLASGIAVHCSRSASWPKKPARKGV